MLRRLLKNRKADLQRLIHQCETWLSKAPQGSLRLSSSHNKTYYYHNMSNVKSGGKLLSAKTDASLIRKLAIKDYYLKIIPAAEEELDAINALLRIKEDQTLAMAYENLHSARKGLINPVEETREKYLSRWIKGLGNNAEPEGGKYYIPTNRGELVRSMNEYHIANALHDEGIPYKYEHPFKAVNGKTYRPDFYVRNPNTGKVYYWEHFGIMDDPEYVRNSFMHKIKIYGESGLIPGYNLIVTFSSKEHELTEQEISDVITKFLK